MSGSKGDVFVAGGWSCAQSIPRWDKKQRYAVRLTFLQAGTPSTWIEGTEMVEWSEEWSGWHMLLAS